MSKDWKSRSEMTPEEIFEDEVRSIIYTSVDDVKNIIPHVSRSVLEEALRRVQTADPPRITLTKMLISAIRKLDKTTRGEK